MDWIGLYWDGKTISFDKLAFEALDGIMGGSEGSIKRGTWAGQGQDKGISSSSTLDR